jgi:AcrR family transcriptional regulator
VKRRAELDDRIDAIYARVPKRSQLDQASDKFARLRAHVPKQERSLRTLHRLLDAAEKTLEEEGLDATTVPAIAQRAGVSVGVVYRRFPSKDALIRGVYERFLWRVQEQNSMMLATLESIQCTLPDLLRGMIHGSVETHRRKRNLLRALYQYAKTHDDPSMKREAAKMNRATGNALTSVILRHAAEIAHPDPAAAIDFVILTLAAVIRAVILDEEATYGVDAPRQLEDELTRMTFAYLGIPLPARGVRRGTRRRTPSRGR